MCELFAMSSRAPATVGFSFEEFVRHGGDTGVHADGWGVAFYEGLDVRIVREPSPACRSPCVRLLREAPITSRFVVSHVRKATQGEIGLHNTQPFQRELGGRAHVFAHNGHLPGVSDCIDRPARFRPIGNTDSELAFCGLLEALAPLWSGDEIPPLAARFEVVERFARTIAPLGPANFVYADGDVLFAHGNRRTQADRTIRPPGLHLLTTGGASSPSAGVTIHSGRRVSIVASLPLSEEPWRPLDRGQLIALRGGEVVLDSPAR